MKGRGFRPVVLVLAAAPSPLMAQDRAVEVTASARYDDNIRRIPEADRASAPHDGADLVGYISARAHLDTAIRSIGVSLDANMGRSFFLRNSELDTFDYGGRLQLERMDERSSFKLLATHVKRPIAFDDATNLVKASQRLVQFSADASHNVFGNFRLVAKGDFLRNSTDIPGRRTDSQSITWGGGIGYYSPTGSVATLEYREVRTRGLQGGEIVGNGQTLFYNARSTDRSFAARVTYDYSVVTQIQATIGYTRHDDRSILDADFKGITADVRVNWSPIEGMKITPRYARSFGTENALYSNGVRETILGLDAQGGLGASLQWRAYWSQQKRTFRYDVTAPDPASLARRDSTSRMGATLIVPVSGRWNSSLQFDRLARRSTLAAYRYRDKAVTLVISRAF